MDTILLIIGIVGFCICGWGLKGYLQNTPSASPSSDESASKLENETSEVTQESTTTYVTLEEHKLVLKRLAELEKGDYTPKAEDKATVQNPSLENLPSSQAIISTSEKDAVEPTSKDEPLNSEQWKEIFALQEAYRKQREIEKEIDYEREQTLFDLSQGYDGKFTGVSTRSYLSEEQLTDQRLLDNQYEEGEELGEYHKRVNQFASMTKEMLIMRLDASDRQLREQQEKHQAMLLTIISTLIERLPNDVNLKSVAQSSYVAASTEISNEEGEPNRNLFKEMFFEHLRK